MFIACCNTCKLGWLPLAKWSQMYAHGWSYMAGQCKLWFYTISFFGNWMWTGPVVLKNRTVYILLDWSWDLIHGLEHEKSSSLGHSNLSFALSIDFLGAAVPLVLMVRTALDWPRVLYFNHVMKWMYKV